MEKIACTALCERENIFHRIAFAKAPDSVVKYSTFKSGWSPLGLEDVKCNKKTNEN